MSNINDFGRTSFVTHTTGLIERMEKCTMIKYRDKSGKIQEVEGNLFVTKDKNGKDVFAGDKIKAVISDVSSDSLVGTIVQNENPLACWMFKYRFDEERFGEKEHLAPAPDLQDIELIEDKIK